DAWEAFCTSCDNKYRFHPEHDGPITAAKHLGQRVTSEWQLVWNRFGENPTAYPNIPDLLRQGRNLKDMPLFHDASSWPQDNEAAEDALRLRLSALLDAQPADARKQLTDLENEHGKRRGWVWARLGQSPLAHAVEHLAALA